MSAPLLQVRDLVVQYGPPEAGAAVDGVSFDVSRGQAVGVLGESGCGKTTLAMALMGFLPPAGRVAGSIRLGDHEIVTMAERERERLRGAEIAAIFQEPGLALNPVLRVGTQVAEVVRAHRRWEARRCRREAQALLAEVRLDGLYDAYPHELSGGQRQRVLIAQAVACRPALLVADEPTAALDAMLELEVLELLQELRARHGLALVLISHRLPALAAVAERLLVMYAGAIVEEGPLGDVLARPAHPYTRALIASVPHIGAKPAGRLASIPGQPPSAAMRSLGCAFEPRCRERIEPCRTRAPGVTLPAPDRRVRCFLHGS